MSLDRPPRRRVLRVLVPCLIMFLVASQLTVPTSVRSGPTGPVFVFAAAGDHSFGTAFTNSLNLLSTSGANFYVALGDLSYVGGEQNWCNVFKSKFNNIELIAGNHDSGESSSGDINVYDQYCPFTLTGVNFNTGSGGCTVGVTGCSGNYGKEYYFDYPATSPIARFIGICAGVYMTIDGTGQCAYSAGSARFNWVSQAIDDARAKGIKWIAVFNHKNYISDGGHGNEIGADLFNLFVSKKIDLILEGHSHNYARSVQFQLSPGCTSVPGGVNPAFNSACVANNGSTGTYTVGQGPVLNILGTFGQSFASCTPSSWWASVDCSTHGLEQFSVFPDHISAQFKNSDGTFTDSYTIAGTSSSLPDPDHVVVILMENHALSSIYGPAPYMTSLANTYGLATHLTAITHPSEPNYLALTSGSTQGVTSDGVCCYNINAPNIIDRLEAAGLAWKAFAEDSSGSGTCSFTPPRNGDHFPFKVYSDMNTAARCANFLTTGSPGDTEFVNYLNSPSPANYVWLTPNDCDNMHSCSVSTGDNYLSNLVPKILSSTMFATTNAVLLITFDEGSSSYPADYVYTVWAGPVAKKAFQSSTQYSHYSTLKTWESFWNLPSLTANDAGATAMTEFFGVSGPALTASFTFSPSPAVAGQVMAFTGTVSGGISPYTFTWDFGDSATGSGNPVTHSYTANGTYTVKMTVTDASSPTHAQTTVSNTVVVGTPLLAFVKNPTAPLLLGHTEPEAIKIGSVYYLYYRCDTCGVGAQINVMSTTDGVTFTELGPVLTKSSSGWDSIEVISPSVLYDGGTYYLYYEGASSTGRAIGVATSSSPTGPFTKYSGNPILTPSVSWEGSIVGTPAIAKIGVSYFLFYHGNNGQRDQGGVAYSSSPLGPWTKEPNNPILPIGPAGAWDQAMTAPSSTFVVSSSRVWLFYEGSDGTSWRSGLAIGNVDPLYGRIKSLSKTPQPIINLGLPGSFDSHDAQLPGAVFTGTELWVYYSGNDGIGFHLGRVVAQYIQTITGTLSLSVPGSKNINEGVLLTFTATATDSSPSATVTLSASSLPRGASFPSVTGAGSVTGTFYWTPSNDQVGTYTVTFTTTDNGSPPVSDTKTVVLQVAATGGGGGGTGGGNTPCCQILPTQGLTLWLFAIGGTLGLVISLAVFNLKAHSRLEHARREMLARQLRSRIAPRASSRRKRNRSLSQD